MLLWLRLLASRIQLSGIESLFQDLRYAMRMLRKNPAFAVAAIVTLALGLGLNTVLFTVFNAFVLRPLAVRDPYNLYQVIWRTKQDFKLGFSWREYSDLKNQKAVFSDAVALSPPMKVTLEKRWTLFGMAVSGNYFSSLNGETILGRPILTADAEKPGEGTVAVLSYNLWRNCFAADPTVIGRKVLINGHPFEVIGVMRQGFEAVTPSYPNATDVMVINMGNLVQFWIPLTAMRYVGEELNPPGPAQTAPVVVVARLRSSVSQRQAESALLSYAQQATSDLPLESRAIRVQLLSRATYVGLSPEIMVMFLPLLIAFGLVLLLCCTNVANMMLARALTRQREVGIRLSLGASRARVMRQLLTEGLLIALLAGLAGVAIAGVAIRVGLHTFTTLWKANIPGIFAMVYREAPLPALSLDYRVFVLAFLLAALVTIVFALAPALQATRPNISRAMCGEISGIRPSRLRGLVLAGQVAVCVLFLIFSGILLRTISRASSIDPGFQIQGIFQVECSKPQAIQIAERLREQVWIERIAIASRVPLDLRQQVAVGRPDRADLTQVLANVVSPDYFAVFGIPVIRGRHFSPQEGRTEQPVVILSEGLAKKLWPNEDPVGKTIHTEAPNPRFKRAEVVGVVKDVANEGILYPRRHCVYFPTDIGVSDSGVLVLRSKIEESKTAQMLAAILRKVSTSEHEEEPWYASMQILWDRQMLPVRVASDVSSLLGVLALLLTVSGIYGVASYLISQRTKEIGIRIALGATTKNVVRFVMHRSMRLSFIGMWVGVLLAVWLSRLLSANIEARIGDFDLVPYVAGPVVIMFAAALAVLGPVRRATVIDPSIALRTE